MATPHDGDPTGPLSIRAVTPVTRDQLRVLRIGEVELELDARQVRVAGESKHLPPREFHMLSILMDNVGRVVGRRELLDALWGPGHRDTSKSLETHINRLRRRLSTPGGPQRIRTVHGQGYVFDLPESARP